MSHTYIIKCWCDLTAITHFLHFQSIINSNDNNQISTPILNNLFGFALSSIYSWKQTGWIETFS